MRSRATALAIAEALIIAYMLLRREYKRRNSILFIMEENKKRISILESQIGTSNYSIEAMIEENAQLRHKLAVEMYKYKFIEDENNQLRGELYNRNIDSDAVAA